MNHIFLSDQESKDNFSKFLKVDRISKRRFDIETKRYSYVNTMQWIHLTKGSFKVKARGKLSTLDTNQLLIIPSHVPHQLEIDIDCDGYIYSTTIDLWNEMVIENGYNVDHLMLDKIQRMDFSVEEESLFLAISKELYMGMNQFAKTGKKRIESFLLINIGFIIKMLEKRTLLNKQEQKEKPHFQNFDKLMRAHGKTQTSLKEYATQLGITTTHLNRVCKSKTGKVASEIMNLKITTEAKYWLLQTSLSMAEIAHRMEFSNPNYFGRFFKAQTGMTPRKFRLSYKEK